MATLPESYQSAILMHHNQVKNDLQPVFNAMNAPLDCLKENESSIGLVICLEEDEGKAIALAVILPVQGRLCINIGQSNEKELPFN